MHYKVKAICICLSIMLLTMFGEAKETKAMEQRVEIVLNEPYCAGSWNIPQSYWYLSTEEQELLQKLMLAEAEGEGDIGMIMVANVVYNRIQSPDFPDTVQEVIYQEGQFASVTDGRLAAAQPNELTEEILTDLQLEYFDLTGGALYFCEASSDQWHNNLEFLYQYHHHKFYRS